MSHKFHHHVAKVVANSSMLMVYFGLLVIPISTIGLLGIKYSYNSNTLTKEVAEHATPVSNVVPGEVAGASISPKDLPSSADGSSPADDFSTFSKDLLQTFQATEAISN